MKIKTWLLLSYLSVMLLPLGATYGLIAWINTYHKEKNVEEYFEKWLELQQIIEVVEKPELYKLGREYEELDQLTSAHTEIYLYSKEGFLLYTSNPIKTTVSTLKSEKDLYQNLYEFQQSYYAYKYRAPALKGKDILGFYEVNLARSEWVTGVSNRSWIIVCIVTAVFLIIFIVVVLLVNRKLNRPLDYLTKQMKVFAEKNEISPIRDSNDEIGELAKSFDEMRRQITVAREKIAMEQHEKEYMIASISHDLKTPLTSIRAYAELLSSSKKEIKSTDEYSQIIIGKSNYMKQMLDDLLMYTVLQSPTYEMELVEVEGSEFFDMLLSDYEALCEERGIILERYCMIDGKYYVNPKQMLRVMDNLTSNAIKHTNSGGHILLLATNKAIGHPKIMPFAKPLLTNDNGMYLIVQNSGEGIDHAELENLFKPLYQADSARTKNNHTGTGLGLSITKQIMEKHGGRVQIVSEKNIGTCVICWLPN